MSKESHGFNPDIAVAIGVKEAIIFGHLIFLHKSNLNNPYSWDGVRYWIRKTNAAFAATYPYFTAKEIRGALEKMERLDMIVGQTGTTNTPFDRTKGYAIQPAGFDLMETKPEERQVFKSPFDKRANGKDKRANQILPQGQMNKDYSSCPSSLDNSNMSAKNADGIEPENLSLEADHNEEIPPIPKPPQVEVPKRDSNDPRPYLEAVLTNLKCEYNWQGTAEKRRVKIIEQGKKAKEELQVENDIDEILNHLSQQAKMPAGYKKTTADHRRPVRKRRLLNSLEEIKMVIEGQCRRWNGTEYRSNLNPATLMNGHFDKYLNAALLDKQNPITANPYATPAFRHEAPPPNTKQPDYVA